MSFTLNLARSKVGILMVSRVLSVAAFVTCGTLLLAGCGGSSDQAQTSAGFDDRTADFIAVATTKDGNNDVAILTGSVAHGEGAGEFSFTQGAVDPKHVMFKTGTKSVNISLPGKGDIELTPSDSGHLTGTGKVIDARGKEVPVNMRGSWSARLDEEVSDSTKCGALDEKTLLVGNPSGKLVDELDRKVDHIDLDLSLAEVATQWQDFDAVIVDAQSKGALASPTTRAFMQGSKWVIITNPQYASKSDLGTLMPAVPKDLWNDTWAVALRAGDPGASWNQDYQTVPLYKSKENQKQGPSQQEVDTFVKQLHDSGDPCITKDETSSEGASTEAEQPTDATNSESKSGVEYSEVFSAGRNGKVQSSVVAVPAAYTYNDSVSERASAPLELPSNVYGFSLNRPVQQTYTLPGSQNYAADKECKDRQMTVGSPNTSMNTWQLRCAKESDRRQTSEVGGKDKILVFLSTQKPASRDRNTRRDDGLDRADVDLDWVVLHQQNTLVNGSTLQGNRGSHELLYDDIANGYVKKLGVFWDDKEIDLRETSWLLSRAHTQVKLGKTARGTAPFATKNEASFPLKSITNSNQGTSLSGSWSVNAGGGTFAAVPVFNLGGSYSSSWSKDTSVSVPNWEVNPSYDSKGVNVAWLTHTTKTGAPATFDDYLYNKVKNFGSNPMNVSGLVANSAYAWQSPCMFGEMEVRVDRKVSFASVYTELGLSNAKSGDGRDVRDRQIKNRVIDWDLRSIKYDIDFGDPKIALYPTEIAGFKDITPHNAPMKYNVKGCEDVDSEYPMPESLKKEIDAQTKAKEAAESKAKADKEAAEEKVKAEKKAAEQKVANEKAAKEKAAQEKAEQESKKQPSGRNKYSEFSSEEQCYKLSQKEMHECFDYFDEQGE